MNPRPTAYTQEMALLLRLSGLFALGLAGCFNPTGFDPGASSTMAGDSTTTATTATTDATTAAGPTTTLVPTGGTTEAPGETTGLSSGGTPVCGDGIVDPLTEECDNGSPEPSFLCDTNCRRTFLLVFVSASTTTGKVGVGGLAGADALCQAEAEVADLPGTYRAWLSDTKTEPQERFGKSQSRAYFRRDGQKIAENWDALVLNGPAVPLSVTASGAVLPSQTPCVDDMVWTGTGPDGKPAGSMFCDSWTSPKPLTYIVTGSALTAQGAAWTNCGGRACDMEARLYCFEQALE